MIILHFQKKENRLDLLHIQQAFFIQHAVLGSSVTNRAVKLDRLENSRLSQQMAKDGGCAPEFRTE